MAANRLQTIAYFPKVGALAIETLGRVVKVLQLDSEDTGKTTLIAQPGIGTQPHDRVSEAVP